MFFVFTTRLFELTHHPQPPDDANRTLSHASSAALLNFREIDRNSKARHSHRESGGGDEWEHYTSGFRGLELFDDRRVWWYAGDWRKNLARSILGGEDWGEG